MGLATWQHHSVESPSAVSGLDLRLLHHPRRPRRPRRPHLPPHPLPPLPPHLHLLPPLRYLHEHQIAR